MAQPATPTWARGNRLFTCDLKQRRLWVGDQRLHHGATGIAVAGAGIAGLIVRRTPATRALAYTLAGGVLMAHDWKDRGVWFRRGPQHD
jgi:hypothetical protein